MIRVPGFALFSVALASLCLAYSPTALGQGPGSVGVPASPAAPIPQAPKAAAPTPAPKAETSATPPKEDSSSEEMPPEVTGEPKISRQGIGNDPGALEYGGLALAPVGGSQLTTTNIKANQINFHGFLRAPLRIGLGTGEPGFGGTKLHSPPRVPDSAYTEWSYTNNLGGPWTELHLSYGNAKVFANVKLAAYNLTDASWKDLTAQLGVNQAWITINLPELFGPKGGILWNVGVFNGRYGSPGRYDAGEYGTYLFGRTHVSGETLSAFYDVTPDVTLQFEHGIGARLDVQTLVPGMPDPPPYLPFPGPRQQLPTLLHHVHLGVTIKEQLILAAHYLTSWTQSQVDAQTPDGHINTMGVEAKLVNSRFGNGYLGFAHLDALNAVRVAGAIEALHSWEGWSLTENFWGDGADGTGKIDTVLGQYVFSLATFLQGPEAFWGQSADLLLTLFGMYNKVSTSDPLSTGAKEKLKYGGEVTYIPLYWLGLAARYNMVQPNLANKYESFQVVSPRVILRTSFVSNEEIYIQYTRYFTERDTRLAFPFNDPPVKGDKQVISLIASMYW
ncbi:MAG TPA: hypothetical protein VFH73_16790 [Polyangia bacterium]|nr:hypothetical protein [Polyangia bacterium]